MNVHVRARTDVVVFLVGAFDSKNVLKFYSKNSVNPGIVFRVEGGLPINDQLIQQTEKVTGWESLSASIEIEQGFRDTVVLPDGASADIYVGKVAADRYRAPSHWKPLPELIRSLPPSGNRKAYLKAWQVLMGGLKEDVKVLDGEKAAKALTDYAHPPVKH